MNTIYEYYERISERYYLSRVTELKSGKKQITFLWDPMAKTLRVPGYEEYDLFISRNKRNVWVYEGLTGAFVIAQSDMPTRPLRRCKIDRFIEAVPAVLNSRGGKGTLNQLIVNFLVDYDQDMSPRYKAKKV
jgi:hypothetical protein